MGELIESKDGSVILYGYGSRFYMSLSAGGRSGAVDFCFRFSWLGSGLVVGFSFFVFCF